MAAATRQEAALEAPAVRVASRPFSLACGALRSGHGEGVVQLGVGAEGGGEEGGGEQPGADPTAGRQGGDRRGDGAAGAGPAARRWGLGWAGLGGEVLPGGGRPAGDDFILYVLFFFSPPPSPPAISRGRAGREGCAAVCPAAPLRSRFLKWLTGEGALNRRFSLLFSRGGGFLWWFVVFNFFI